MGTTTIHAGSYRKPNMTVNDPPQSINVSNSTITDTITEAVKKIKSSCKEKK